MEKTYCIYCHTNKINGKKYIGQTGGDLQKRFGENGYSYRKQMFGRAIKKYGWDNFEHTVLEQGLTLEEANIKEEYYILKYKTTDSAFGYNVRAGGNNSTLSNETKEKLSNSLHKYYENNDVWNKGLKGEYHLHITDERKKQLVEQMKGNEKALGYRHSEEAKIKISKASKMRGNPNKGKKWFNNGIISTMANECPKGWSEGRLSMKEETKEKLRQCNLGKKHSEETKAKMSKVRKIYLNKEVA